MNITECLHQPTEQQTRDGPTFKSSNSVVVVRPETESCNMGKGNRTDSSVKTSASPKDHATKGQVYPRISLPAMCNCSITIRLLEKIQNLDFYDQSLGN